MLWLGDYKATHWAVPRGIYDVMEEDKQMAVIIRTATVTKIAGATGSAVRLRAQPDGKELTIVPFGTIAIITEEVDGWSRFKHGIHDGWMQSKYLPTSPIDIYDMVGDEDSVTVTFTIEMGIKMAALEKALKEALTALDEVLKIQI